MNNLVQASFNWDALDEDTRTFVQQKTDEIHGQLKRTAEGIIKIGQNLIAVKERLGHGQFKPWLQSEFDMSYPTAVRFMQVAERFGKNINLIYLSPSVLYELAAPSTPDTVIEQVTTGEIPPTLDAIREAKAEAEAERQARMELNQQIAVLQEQIASLSASKVKEVKVTPPEVIAQLAQLKEKVQKLTTQRDNLSEQAKKLGTELDAQRDANESRRKQEQYVFKKRENWRKVTDGFQKSVIQLLSQFPLPLDTQVFESDDWMRLDQVKELATRFLVECGKLHSDTLEMIVDADGP